MDKCLFMGDMSRVALIGENSIGYISTLIDIWNDDNCAVLIDWRIPIQTAIQMMREAGVEKCYIEKNLFAKSSDNIINELECVRYEKGNDGAAIIPDFICKKFHARYDRNEAVVIYSSGTTGKSKGVILTHYAINTNADAIIDYMAPSVNDVLYIGKTLSHSSTLTGELLVALKSEMKIVVAPTIIPPRCILNNINLFNVSIACFNPTLLSMVCDEYIRGQFDVSSLRQIYVSGAILTDSLFERSHATFCDIPIYNVYGLSEAGPRVTAQRKGCCLSNSVGKPINGVDLVIVDEKGDVVPVGEYGIIHVNTPSVFNQYISGDTKCLSLFKDWLNTGDIGFVDNHGELHIVDRIDDVMIKNSHKIYPSELEKYILEQTSTKECIVAKIDINDKELIGCLYVGDEREEVIKKTLMAKFMLHEIPNCFLRCDAIPKCLNGKVSKKDVKQKIQDYLSGGRHE